MRLFPMHDIDGHLWPELDWRWVTMAVLKEYECCGRWLVYTRAINGWYGPVGETAVRMRPMPDGRKCRIFEFRPAWIWKAKRWGRWGDPAFDSSRVTTRIYECDPLKTANLASRNTPTDLQAECIKAMMELSASHKIFIEILQRIASR